MSLLLLVATLLFSTPALAKDLPPNFAYNEHLLHNIVYSLSELKLCPNLGLDDYVGKLWIDVPSDKQYELFYCISKIQWSDSSTGDSKSTCDVLMTSEKLWSDMDILEKRYATECGFKRFIQTSLKNIFPALPSLLTDAFLYDHVGRKKSDEVVANCSLVRKQFEEDAKSDYKTFSSQETVRIWSFFKLNISHYKREDIVDDTTLGEFKQNTKQSDYFAWNNLTSCGPHDKANIEFMPVFLTFIELIRKEKPELVVYTTKDEPWKHLE